MIVELPSTTSDYHGGRVRRYRMGFFHFSNNNLAIRKDCARDLGGYDLGATRSEDHQIGFAFETAHFPLLVCLFVTDFHLLHAFLLVAAAAAVLGQNVAAGCAAVTASWFLWRSLADQRHTGLGPAATAALAFHHWVANLAFVTAGVLGGLRHGMVLLPASILRPSPPSAAGQRGQRLARQGAIDP